MNVNFDDVKCVTETSITIRGTRRRTTVPKVIVDQMEMKNGEKLRWCLFKDNSILITKVQ